MLNCSINYMPENPRLAFAYVPFQQWPEKLYDLEKGLQVGTIFPELNQCVCLYEEGETR